jgi:hypothetical protein
MKLNPKLARHGTSNRATSNLRLKLLEAILTILWKNTGYRTGCSLKSDMVSLIFKNFE